MKYDEKLVDELLEAMDVIPYPVTGDVVPSKDKIERAKNAAVALRPKPPKFHVMPEWEEFCKGRETFEDGEVVALMIDETVGVSFGKTIFNAIREATATDKPMVHIPAGKDWSEKDLKWLRDVWHDWDYSTENVAMSVINAIKSKLEGRV